jgi:hypothetical protein
MRGLTKTVTVNGQDITVRELSVAEIRAWMKEIEVDDGDWMDVALHPGYHMSAVRAATGLSREQMDELLPSERMTLVRTCEAVNGDFFALTRMAIAPVLSKLQGKT